MCIVQVQLLKMYLSLLPKLIGIGLLLPRMIVGSEECMPEAMAKCTDPLKVVTDNKDLGFATSLDELAKMCPKLMDGLRCIDDFTYRCLDMEHRNYFNTLYQGTTQVIVDLCQKGPYQTDYLRHAPCMREVQSGYERCADDYQVRIKSLNQNSAGEDVDLDEENGDDEEEESDENVQLLCCSFQQYLHCSESIVNQTCGHETARFTKSFLDRMSGPLIQGHCHAYAHGTNDCLSANHLPSERRDRFHDRDQLHGHTGNRRHDSGDENHRPLWPDYGSPRRRGGEAYSGVDKMDFTRLLFVLACAFHFFHSEKHDWVK